MSCLTKYSIFKSYLCHVWSETHLPIYYPVYSFIRSCFSGFPGIKAWGWFLSLIHSCKYETAVKHCKLCLSESRWRQNKTDELQAACTWSVFVCFLVSRLPWVTWFRLKFSYNFSLRLESKSIATWRKNGYWL